MTRARNVADSGLVLLTQATIGSAVASVTVSNCFNSVYENYRIFITGGSNSTLVELNMRLGSTTSGYYSSLIYCNATGSSGTVANSNGSSFTYVGNASSGGLNSIIELRSPYLAQKTTVSATASTAVTDSYQYIVGGFLNDTTSYTSFTIFPASGSMTGGTIKVYGYK